MIRFKKISKDTVVGRIGHDVDIFSIKPHNTIPNKFVLLNRLPGIKKILGTFDSIPQAKHRAVEVLAEWIKRCDLEVL